MKTYDAAIVGGGIIGGAIAFELSRQNLRVVLLDRQQPGLEASWAAAGMLAPGAETSDSVAVAPLGRVSLAMYPEFVAAVEQASGCRVGFRQTGSLHVFFGAEAERERDACLRLQCEVNLPGEAISAAQAREMEPALGDAARAALWLPHEACVDARALTEAVLGAAAAQGAEIRAGVAVTSVVIEGSRCTGVRAGNETLAAKHVVVAAGSWIGGMDALARYAPTRPVRGQMVALRSERVNIAHVLRSHNGYIVPRADGRLVCGSTSEDAGFEKRVTAAGIQQILRAVVELVPALEDATVLETSCGLRPDTPDHLPSLGPTDVHGLWMATGHYRNGILLAPVTARMMREWICEGRAPADAEKFSPLRFASRM